MGSSVLTVTSGEVPLPSYISLSLSFGPGSIQSDALGGACACPLVCITTGQDAPLGPGREEEEEPGADDFNLNG